jgi:hypothetical protein
LDWMFNDQKPSLVLDTQHPFPHHGAEHIRGVFSIDNLGFLHTFGVNEVLYMYFFVGLFFVYFQIKIQTCIFFKNILFFGRM